MNNSVDEKGYTLRLAWDLSAFLVDEKWYDFEAFEWPWKKTDIPTQLLRYVFGPGWYTSLLCALLSYIKECSAPGWRGSCCVDSPAKWIILSELVLNNDVLLNLRGSVLMWRLNLMTYSLRPYAHNILNKYACHIH
jgi:hypothetical protein